MQPGKKQRKAHTIIELLVASALFIMLLGFVVLALVTCNNYVRNGESKVEAQTQALSASVWLSRSLAEGNVTATCTTTAPATSISFPSPRDPSLGDVAWSNTQGGALIWRQLRFCYFDIATSSLLMKGFPLFYTGVTPTVMWSGFPPFPPTGVVDLPPPQILSSAIMSDATPINKVVARNIRSFYVDVYQPDDPSPERASTANIIVETFVPYYGLDYGITVKTAVRLQN